MILETMGFHDRLGLLTQTLLPDTFAKLLITQRFAENSETHKGFFEKTYQRGAVPSSNDSIFNILVYLCVTDFGDSEKVSGSETQTRNMLAPNRP